MPNIVQPSFPDYPGSRYDFSSIELSFGGLPLPIIIGVQAINYDDNLEPGEVRGTAPQVLATTTGKYEAHASLTLYKTEAQLLIQALGQVGTAQLPPRGYKQVRFDVTVNYGDLNQPTITDQVKGCRIKKSSQDHKMGQEPLVEKFDLHVLYLIRNGQYPYGPGIVPGQAKFFP